MSGGFGVVHIFQMIIITGSDKKDHFNCCSPLEQLTLVGNGKSTSFCKDVNIPIEQW